MLLAQQMNGSVFDHLMCVLPSMEINSTILYMNLHLKIFLFQSLNYLEFHPLQVAMST